MIIRRFILTCLVFCNVACWVIRVPAVLRTSQRQVTLQDLDFFGRCKTDKYVTKLFHPRLIDNERDRNEEEHLFWLRSLPPMPRIGRNVTARVEIVKDSGLRLSVENYKKWLFMPISETAMSYSVKTMKNFVVGQYITAPVIAKFKGLWVMSLRRIELRKIWARVQELHKTAESFNVTIRKGNKGGLETRAFGLKAFLPASHLTGGPFDKDAMNSTFFNKTLEVQVLLCDPQKGKLVLTQRRSKAIEDPKRFDLVNVTCSGVREFGAFFILPGGRTGLAHVSKLTRGKTWPKVDQLFAAGDTAVAVVLDDGTQSGRISLATHCLEVNDGDLLVNKTLVFERAEQRWFREGLRERVIAAVEAEEASKRTRKEKETVRVAQQGWGTLGPGADSRKNPKYQQMKLEQQQQRVQQSAAFGANHNEADDSVSVSSGSYVITDGELVLPGVQFSPSVKKRSGAHNSAPGVINNNINSVGSSNSDRSTKAAATTTTTAASTTAASTTAASTTAASTTAASTTAASTTATTTASTAAGSVKDLPWTRRERPPRGDSRRGTSAGEDGGNTTTSATTRTTTRTSAWTLAVPTESFYSQSQVDPQQEQQRAWEETQQWEPMRKDPWKPSPATPPPPSPPQTPHAAAAAQTPSTSSSTVAPAAVPAADAVTPPAAVKASVSSLLRSPYVDKELLASVVGSDISTGEDESETLESILGDLLADTRSSSSSIRGSSSDVSDGRRSNPAAFTAQALGSGSSSVDAYEEDDDDIDNDERCRSGDGDGDNVGVSGTIGRRLERDWHNFEQEPERKQADMDDDDDVVLHLGVEEDEEDQDDLDFEEDLLSDVDLLERDLRLYEAEQVEQQQREYDDSFSEYEDDEFEEEHA